MAKFFFFFRNLVLIPNKKGHTFKSSIQNTIPIMILTYLIILSTTRPFIFMFLQ